MSEDKYREAQYTEHRAYAKRLMRHYFQNSVNFVWHPDNGSEMDTLVDALINAAVAKVAMEKEA